ncbi:MAG: hypothetical protein H6934_04595 [Burkholderiaceae bacterium]|nr:hypothetical protein [Burkholderiaceae bacterium]
MSTFALLRNTAVVLAVASSVCAPARAAGDVPPTEARALLGWLQAGSYKNWRHESAAHPSAGPHPARVIAYLNPALDASLAAKAAAHPSGASAVKELFDAAGKLSGWAVSVKTEADSRAGQGWFWYEILGTTPASQVVASAKGVPLCYGCHTPGRDFVLIPYPLK